MAAVLNIIKEVQDAAEREAKGDTTAHVELLKGIQKLQIAATNPTEKFLRIRFQIYQNVCIRIAQEYGILQALVAQKKKMSAQELSQVTKADELLIVRILRLVTYVGVVDEVGPSEYLANETTELSVRKGIIGDVKYYTDIAMRVCSHMGPMAKDGKLFQFPTKGQLDPHTTAFGQDGFHYMGEHREYGQAFEDFMTARRAATWSQWFEIYPAGQELPKKTLKESPESVLLVDIAGGQGYWTQRFQQAVSKTLPGRLIVEDQPFVIENAKLEGVEKLSYDFFNPQPIQGARAYYLKQIMHNWSDANCQKILQHTVDAMEKDYSTVLINDYVLPEEKVGLRAASMDIAMLVLLSGLERTEKQWKTLVESVGLKIVKIWVDDDTHEGNEAVIECEKI